MIQTYNDIDQEIQNFRKNFKDYAQIQKIYSSSQFISVQIRLPGKSLFLYFGRGHNFEGFWLGTKQVESPLRKRDQLLEYFRRYLSASVLLDLDLDQKDRIIRIKYGRFGQTNRLLLFYCGRELYFANIYFDEKDLRFKTFCSWQKGIQDIEAEDFKVFDSIGRKDIAKDIELKMSVHIEKLLAEEKARALSMVGSGKSKKFLSRKKKNITSDIAVVGEWPKLFKFVEEGSDFDKLSRKENLFGFKVNFKSKEHYKRKDELYTKVKKLKKAQRILSLRLSDTEESLKHQVSVKHDFENKLKIIKPIWSQSFKAEEVIIEKAKGYIVHTFPLFKLAVGLSSSGNDQMRKEWGRKEDIWFHAHGDKSPHIIIKNHGSLIDMTLFQVVASAMLYYMKNSKHDVSLLYTQVKNLKGVKGVAGSVNYKKEKYINVILEKSWDSILSDFKS